MWSRLGQIRSSLVDTRLTINEVIIDANGAEWDSSSPANTAGNPLKSIGDFNGDGYDDLLVNYAQPSTASSVLVMLGNDDSQLTEINTITLMIPDLMATAFFGIEAASAGDVNGDGAPDLIIGGYKSDFTGSAYAIYFGCNPLQLCDQLELTTADSVITTTGSLRTSIAGAGDFISRLGVNFDDIVIGGGLELSGVSSDPRAAYVVEGRETWPAELDASAPDLMTGIYALETPYSNTGVQATNAGDLNSDGSDELLFSAGGSIDHLFLAYSSAELVTSLELNAGLISYNGANPDFIELSNPCADLGNTNLGTLLRGGTDLSGDGLPDMVIGNSSDKLLIIMDHNLNRLDCFRRGENRFGYRFDLAGDINGDGAVDLIVVNDDDTLINAEKALIFYNNGAGIFGADQAEVGRAPSMEAKRPNAGKLAASAAGDMNGDGRDDFAVLTFVNNQLKVTIFY